ncbi:aminotransferase class I/II-fold pyridoxal phosphate-dependent enzyme [Spelaeicoccus albus]
MSAITRLIRTGDLPPGSLLPSIRELSRTTGLSPGTVATALKTLASRGLIVSRQGKRSFVADLTRLPAVYSRSRHPGLIDLSKIEPDPRLLPDVASFFTPNLYVPSMYDATNVIPELATPLEARFQRDGVVGALGVTNGALDAIERISQVWLHPGDRVIVEDPCWTTQRTLLQMLGLEAVGVTIDDEGIDPRSLANVLSKRKCAALMITPRAQNPTGATMSIQRRDAIRAVIEDFPDLLVIEDDHFSELSQEPYPSLTYGRNLFAVIRSYSKIFGPDLRLAAVCMDQNTADQVHMRQLLGPGWVSHIIQRLTARMLTDEVTMGEIGKAAEIYKQRRDLLINTLAVAGLKAKGVSGFTVYVPVPQESDTVITLAERGWGVQAGGPYRIDSDPFIRVCVSALNPEDVLKFANDLIIALDPSSRILLR